MLITFDYIFLTGILAQLLFGLRVLVQWFITEKNKKVASPSIFWILSLAASTLFLVYGWLRKDWVIIVGQSLSFYVYIKNLQLNRSWYAVPVSVRYCLQLVPPVMWIMAPFIFPQIDFDFFVRLKIPLWLLLLGFTGQLFMNLRFIVQMFYSIKQRHSGFPLAFWFMSISGSILLIVYGIFRNDAVLIISQFFSIIPYSRNIHFALKKEKQNKSDSVI
ncbi:MAG: lauroyl acyltransferase [Cyclobacteriaceae bacterium]|nr:MAG: lauroyl acyltransferase [Cyclobacteriaceae bacterium]